LLGGELGFAEGVVDLARARRVSDGWGSLATASSKSAAAALFWPSLARSRRECCDNPLGRKLVHGRLDELQALFPVVMVAASNTLASSLLICVRSGPVGRRFATAAGSGQIASGEVIPAEEKMPVGGRVARGTGNKLIQNGLGRLTRTATGMGGLEQQPFSIRRAPGQSQVLFE